MKYIKLITQTPEQATDQDNKQRAKSARTSIELVIAEKRQALNHAETTVETSKKSLSFQPDRIYSAQSNVDLLNRQISYYEALLKELF